MKKYSQNDEDFILSNYFKGFKGNLLSIGENDGRTLSNSLRLIEEGWNAVLFEPSEEAFRRLSDLHKDNKNVLCLKYGLAGQTGTYKFYESGSHLKNGDVSLLSTLVETETDKWEEAGEEFTEKSIECLSFEDALTRIRNTWKELPFDFITIDAEAVDVIILKQIDLSNVKALCIEYNKDEAVKAEIMEYCAKFGMNTIIYQSYENLVITKNVTLEVEPLEVVESSNAEEFVVKEVSELSLTSEEEHELYGDATFVESKVSAYQVVNNAVRDNALFNAANLRTYSINWDLIQNNMDILRILRAINPQFTKEAAAREGISQYLK